MSHHSNTTTTFLLMLAAAVLPLAGCGGGGKSSTVAESSAIAGSCNNVSRRFCVEYTGSDYRAMKMQRVCEAQQSAFLTGPCPTAGRVGSCLVRKGENSESYYRYYTGFPGLGVKPTGGVAAAAERQCTMLKGEWIAN
jgi:hypothetical protein